MTAADLVPDLSDQGFRLASSGALPSLGEEQDGFFAIYVATGGVSSIRVEVSLQPSSDSAAARFGVIAEALRIPPPDLFGPGTSQASGEPVYDADDERSYVTARPDGQGNLVYSDAYRMGRAIVIVYTLGTDAEAARAMRELVASRVDARAPR